jgi:hypothetical protein
MRISKGKILPGLLLIAMLLAALWNGNNLLIAAQNLLPTPLPVTPPRTGITPTPNSVALPSDLPTYFVTTPAFSGRALHWTNIGYNLTLTSQDPANGKPVNGEIWARVGEDGSPMLIHERFTLDGAFHQEILQTPNAITTIMGTGYPKSPPTASRDCTTRGNFSIPPIKLFIDEAKLPQFGFSLNGGLTKQLPRTPSLPGVKSLSIFDSATDAHRWITQQTENGTTILRALEVGTRGRLLAWQTKRIDANGRLINETWGAYGPLEIYAAADVPTSVLSISKDVQESCNG